MAATEVESSYSFRSAHTTTSLIRDSVSALDSIVRSEEARTALFRPLDEDALRSQSKNLIEIVTYNLLYQSHLEVFNNKQANPNRFSDVTSLGFNLLYTAFGAVGHMNGVNATSSGVGAAKHPPHVKTLFEPIMERQANGELHSLGVRVFHLNYAVPATGVQASGADAASKSAAAADSDENDSSDDVEEMSVDGNDADEEMIRKRDKKLLDRAANTKAKNEMRQQRTLTFGGAFAQMVNDAQAYRDAKQRMREAGPQRKEIYKRLTDELKDGVHLLFNYEDAFMLASTNDQFEKVTRMHLRAHKRVDAWDDGEQALDPRPFAVPGVEYNKDTMGPVHALDVITAMAYYTDPICDEQKDLTRYFALSDDTIRAVLSGDPTFEGDAEARRNAMLAEDNLDVADIMNMSMEDARRYSKNATGGNLQRVRELFTRDPARIAFMLRANLKPTDFRGFPFPEHVYELNTEYCRAEVIFQVPLPVPLFVPLTGLRGTGAIASETHRAHLLNMMRTQQMLRDTRDGRIASLITAGAAELALRQRMTDYTLALRSRIADTFQFSKSRTQGASVMAGGALTPEGVLRLMAMIHDQSKLFGFHAMSDLALTCVCNEVERLAVEAAKQGHLKFKETFVKAYNEMIESFGVHTEKRTNEEYSQQRRIDDALERGDHAAAEAAQKVKDKAPARPTRSDAEMLSNVESARARFLQAAVENIERLQTVDPAAAEMLQVADEQQGVATYLGNVPPEIIELDDALQLYKKNSTAYARLALEFTHAESSAATVGLFKTRLWESITDAAHVAHDTFFESDNIDPVTKKARTWFKSLAPDQREAEFRMLYDVRPNTNMRIFVNESLASPGINASQNATALLLTYFGSLHHCRWYINSNDPKTNVLLAGDGTSGKSFILHIVDYLSPPGVATTLTYMSNHAMHVKANNDGYLTIFHEAMHRLLHPNSPGKDGSQGESGDAANFLKDRLTRGRCSVLVLHHDPKTKERSQLFFETSAQGLYIMATNDSTKGADDNVLSRFIVFSVPKPRDQAEGSNPTERVVDLSMEGQRYVASHYSERVAHQHRLLRFRYMYMEFMNKAGVIPDGFQTYGGRILIDNILNEMHESYSIDTRDQRKRKITEEMARSMAGLYAVFMGLGSPLAKWYAKLPEVNGDLWTPDAFLAITAPFMFISKDHVIDALSLLESIWAPQYQTRILFTIAFGVAQLHHMTNSSFRIVSKSASKDGNHMYNGYPGNNTQSEVDYRYVAIEDSESDTHINQRIAEHCSKYGIRAADVDAYLFRCSKQWMPMRRLEVVPPTSFPPVGTTTTTDMPTTTTSMSQRSDAPKIIGAVRPSSTKRGGSLADQFASVATGFLDSEDSQDLSDEKVAQMDREVDAYEAAKRNAGRDARRAKKGPTEPEETPPPSPPLPPKHECVRLCFTKDASMREQVVRREHINHDNRSKGGRRLCISVEFLMRHLPFDVTKPETMLAIVAADKAHPHKHFEAVKVDMQAARSTPGSRWGRRCDVNFTQRVIAARNLATLGGESLSPIMRSIQKVLSNAYLEIVPKMDTEAVDYMERMTRQHQAEVAADTDPAKKTTLPWMSYVTSLSVQDYTIESKDAQRHPEGRTISFYDALKMLPLQRDSKNLRPIMRHNHARLSIFGREMLAFEQLGHQGAGNSQDKNIIGALDRSRIMNQAVKVGYTADIDYYEASYRMKSMAHPGLKGINMSRLIAFPPVTYNVIKAITNELYAIGAYQREPRANVVEYPEDDVSLKLEYPTHMIVKRIREFEEVDRNEANNNWSHVTPMDDIYMLDSTVGPLNFRHLHEEFLERRKAVDQFGNQGGGGGADSSTLTADATRYLKAFAPKKQKKRPMFKRAPPPAPVRMGGGYKRIQPDTDEDPAEESDMPTKPKQKKKRTAPAESDAAPLVDTEFSERLINALLGIGPGGGRGGATAATAALRQPDDDPVQDEMADFS